MKRYFAAGGAVLLAACWPLAVGQIGQLLYQDHVVIEENANVVVDSYDYQRGYLSSDIYTNFTFTGPAAEALLEDGLPISWQVHSQVQHGLLSITTDNVLLLDENQRLVVDNIWGSQIEPLHVKTVSQLNGQTEIEVVLNALNYEESGDIVSSDTVTLQGSVGLEGNEAWSLMMPAFSISSSDDERIMLKDLNVSFEGVYDDGFWLGTQSVSVASVAYESSYQRVHFDNLTFSLLNDLQEEYKFSHNNRWKLQGVEVDDMLVMRDLTLDVDLQGLDYKAIKQLAGLADGMDDQQRLIDENDVALGLDLLFTQGIDLWGFNLGGKFEDKDFSIDGRFTLPAGVARVSQNPFAALDVISGAVEISAQKELVDTYGVLLLEQLPAWLEQGIVVENGNDYQTRIGLEKSQLVFMDDSSLPIFALLMLLL